MTWHRKIYYKLDEWIPTRYVIALWAFVGMTNIYAMRVNLNVAIVAMVKDRHTNTSLVSGEVCHDTAVVTNSTIKENSGEFDWDEKFQGMILSSFFWGYIFTQIPGGLLAEKFSGKWLYGLGIFSTAFFTLLTPIAARQGVWYLIGVRIIEGLFEGVTFPAIYSMLAKWSPPMERSQIFSFIHLGVCIGTIIASPVSGFLIGIPVDNGWPFVFYFFGAAGIIWFVFWIFFAFETPDVHPRISQKERDYIVKSIREVEEKELKLKSLPVPWKDILTSLPFWAIMIAHFGFNWGFNTLLTNLPTYLKTILRFNIKQSAFLSALPYLSKTFVTVGIGYGADFLRRRKYLNTTNTRRIANSISTFLPAAAFIAIPFAGCNKAVALGLLIFTASCHAGSASGFLCSHVDLSSNFAGTLFGLTNTLGTASGIAAPYFVGAITNNNATIDRWGIVFYVAAGIHIVTNFFYVIFISGEEQHWNNPKTETKKETKAQEKPTS